MFTREPSPDVELETTLIWRARQMADTEIQLDAAAVELGVTAEGRADLLASAAGSQIGTYLASPRTTDPRRLLAGTLLVLAGADPDLVEEAAESVRQWTGALTPGAA